MSIHDATEYARKRIAALEALPQIEKLQETVAAAHQFTIENHRLELYGLCATCAVADQ